MQQTILMDDRILDYLKVDGGESAEYWLVIKWLHSEKSIQNCEDCEGKMPLFCAWWCFFTHEVAGDIFSMSQEANEYFKWSQRSWQRLTKHHRNMIIEEMSDEWYPNLPHEIKSTWFLVRTWKKGRIDYFDSESDCRCQAQCTPKYLLD